jgi:hypothetical protein
MSEPLARVVDKYALDSSDGGRARLKVTVPTSWLSEGARLAITAPKLLACARCDGGGCDACDRSGALRGPRAPERREIQLELPSSDDGNGVILRLQRPFEEGEIDQLLVQIRTGSEPSRGVTRISPIVVASGAEEAVSPSWSQIALVAAAILAAILALTL